MEKALALVYQEYGKPKDVIRLEERTVGAPGPDEVKLRILAAPVHPSDFGMILGNYGRLEQLPTVAGREGVAEVLAVGSDVTDLEPGDRVAVPSGTGSWQTLALAPAKNLFSIPSDIPLEMAAMATINPPTAWRLLRDSGMAAGDWVVQNAANSAVGLHVIEMSRHLGLKTLNVVRRPELVEPLLARGADVVVLEDSGYEKKVAELTGAQPVKLALNSVGGESAMRLMRALSSDGIHITFGAMQFDPVRFPTRSLIFDGLVMKGFWMDKWMRSNSPARVRIMFDKIFDLMRKGIVSPHISTVYPIGDYVEAIESAQQPRMGKVLFRFGD